VNEDCEPGGIYSRWEGRVAKLVTFEKGRAKERKQESFYLELGYRERLSGLSSWNHTYVLLTVVLPDGAIQKVSTGYKRESRPKITMMILPWVLSQPDRTHSSTAVKE
jgi:hypothetical protein